MSDIQRWDVRYEQPGGTRRKADPDGPYVLFSEYSQRTRELEEELARRIEWAKADFDRIAALEKERDELQVDAAEAVNRATVPVRVRKENEESQ